jgi:hypothetical protein
MWWSSSPVSQFLSVKSNNYLIKKNNVLEITVKKTKRDAGAHHVHGRGKITRFFLFVYTWIFGFCNSVFMLRLMSNFANMDIYHIEHQH